MLGSTCRTGASSALAFRRSRLDLIEEYAVAKFIVPGWGDKVDSGIGLSYRPARLLRLEGRYEMITLCQSQP